MSYLLLKWLHIIGATVVVLQGRLRDLAREAADQGRPLSEEYYRCYRRWIALGWPGFTGVLLIMWWMVSKQGWGT